MVKNKQECRLKRVYGHINLYERLLANSTKEDKEKQLRNFNKEYSKK